MDRGRTHVAVGRWRVEWRELLCVRRHAMCMGGQYMRSWSMVRVLHRPVQAAGRAKGLAGIRRHQPVAGVMRGIRAIAHLPLRIGQGTKDVPVGRQRAQLHLIGQKAESASAPLAFGILEIERLSTMLTFKQFHDGALVGVRS